MLNNFIELQQIEYTLRYLFKKGPFIKDDKALEEGACQKMILSIKLILLKG